MCDIPAALRAGSFCGLPAATGNGMDTFRYLQWLHGSAEPDLPLAVIRGGLQRGKAEGKTGLKPEKTFGCGIFSCVL